MPAEDREGTEAAVGRWLKQPGDAVEEHEPLLEINTDKVTVEIAAPAAGLLGDVLKREGEAVRPGELLGRIRKQPDEGALSDPTPSSTSGEPELPALRPERVQAPHQDATGLSPAVRRMLREHGLAAGEIPKVARGGRLTPADVQAFVTTRPSQAGTRSGRMVPHTPMRKAIAAHMLRSVQAAPHVTSVFSTLR